MTSGDIVTTITGHLGQDGELRFTPSGSAVYNVNIANTPRRFNKQSNEWEDGDTTWVRLNIWRQMAEHCAETLVKGMRVVVTGRLRNRKWTDNDGQDRWSLEMDVDEIGPSLKYATAKVSKTTGGGGPTPPPPEDPWAGAASGGGDDAPPW